MGDGEADDAPSSAQLEPRLTVAAVAHRLGVAPATLRTWARRYGRRSEGERGGRAPALHPR